MYDHHFIVINSDKQMIVDFSQHRHDAVKQPATEFCKADADGTLVARMRGFDQKIPRNQFSNLRRDMCSRNMQMVGDGPHRHVTLAFEVPDRQ